MSSKDETIKKLAKDIAATPYVSASKIPGIDLYMDQVTTFMEEQLSGNKRYEDDKILTKTMINNYAKNDLIPPPVKKKYNKEQMLLLLMVYYFKNSLSIGDIKKVISPVIEGSYSNKELEEIYTKVYEKCNEEKGGLVEDVDKYIDIANEMFEDDNYSLFSFIALLNQDICSKLSLMEKLIDSFEADLKEK